MTISVLLVILYRVFSDLQGCREKHTHFSKKSFSLNTLFHEGAPLPLAKNYTPLKSKMHPPLNRNCTPLMGFYQNHGSFSNKVDSFDTKVFETINLFLFAKILAAQGFSAKRHFGIVSLCALWITLLETATIHADNRITFRFKDGTDIEVGAE